MTNLEVNFIVHIHVEKQTEYIGFSTTQFQASTRDLSVFQWSKEDYCVKLSLVTEVAFLHHCQSLSCDFLLSS